MSLFEVIIVLAITSMTIVTSVGLLSRNVRAVKNNEIEDFMNGKVLKAVEALKSTNKVLVSDAVLLETAGTRLFSLTQRLDGVYYLEFEQSPALTIDNCNPNSAFYNNSESYPYCLEVTITTVFSQSSVKYYNLQSKIVFTLDGDQKRITEINLFRYAEFETV